MLISFSRPFRIALLLMALSVLSPIRSIAQTLSAGDIAIIGYNSDDPDGFAFVTLADIPEGEFVFFTEEGWNTGDWSNTIFEGTLGWQSGVGGTPCGTIISIEETGMNTFAVTSGVLTFSGVSWSLWDGDQILVYQGSRTSPTFITALNADYDALDYDLSTSWNNNGGAFARSTVPPGLINGVNCLALFPAPGPELDNAIYSGSLTGSTDSVRRWIMDYNNWIANDFLAMDLSPASFPTPAMCFSTCVLPDIPVLGTSTTTVCPGDSATLYIMSGSLNDATSWEWYGDGCNATWVGSGDTIYVRPTVRTSYFVRGEGDCFFSPENCATIDLSTDTLAPDLTCPDDITVCVPNTGFVPPLNLEDFCGLSSTTYILSGATTDFGIGYIEDLSLSPGLTIASYSAEDASGNSVGCAFEINYTPLNNTVTLAADGLTAFEEGAEYQWFSCDSEFGAISGAIEREFMPSFSGDYAVEITKGACVDTSTCVRFERPSGITGIPTKLSLQVFPSPVQSLLYIEGLQQGSMVYILSSDGSLVLQTESASEIDVAHFKTGIYMLVERTDRATRTVSFAKF
jgi:hypothetical protein